MRAGASQGRARVVWTYRIATAIVVLWMVTSGVMALAHATPIMAAIAKLGYPTYFVWFLGVSKLAEAGALMLPVPHTLRSWAYAGSTFELLAAVFSYGAISASAGEIAAPLVFLTLVHASRWSWNRCLTLRPA